MKIFISYEESVEQSFTKTSVESIKNMVESFNYKGETADSNPLESPGVPWSPLESLGVPWSPLESLGVLGVLGVPRSPRSPRSPWSPLESRGVPWSPVGSRGVPWSPYKYYYKSTKLS